MTGPLDESAALADSEELRDAYVDDNLDGLTDEELSARSWRIIYETRRRLQEHRPPIDGPQAWEHVEALVDLALAERAQRTVDRIVKRKRADS